MDARRGLAAKSRASEEGRRGVPAAAPVRALVETITPFELLCGLGLACNFIWCTLEGHSSGFVASMEALDRVVNSRIFFQLGFFVIACAMIVAPRALQRRAVRLDVCIPVASCAATIAFAVSYRLGGVASGPLCVVGLVGSGIGYCWLVTRFYLCIMERRGFASAVVSTAVCLVFKEVLLGLLLTRVPADAQVVVAAAMPIAMAVLLAAAIRFRLGNGPSRAAEPASAADGTNLELSIVFSVVFALLLSVIRGYSRLGMWGADAVDLAVALPAPLRMAVVAVLVAAFAALLVLPRAGGSPVVRFHAAIVIVGAGFFLICLQAYLGYDDVLYACLQVEEYFGHMAMWASVCTVLECRPHPVLRSIGVPLAAYSGASVLFVALMSIRAVLVFGFALIVAYVAIVLLAHVMAKVAGRRTEAPASPQPVDQSERSALAAVDRSCAELARTHALSEREAQILPMVVEGRSRSYISNDLHLSDSTVKTHISRIYAKLSVSNRQELIDLVFGVAR